MHFKLGLQLHYELQVYVIYMTNTNIDLPMYSFHACVNQPKNSEFYQNWSKYRVYCEILLHHSLSHLN